VPPPADEVMSDSRLMSVTAGLLVAGMVSFMIGAAIPLAWLEKPGLVPEVWSAPLERYLQLIAQHRRSWAWSNCFMIAAVVLNGAGLAALAGFAGQPAVTAGAAGYAIAAVFWIVVASYRNTVSVWAADQLAATNSLPEASTGLDLWSGMAFQIYTAVGHGSQAAVGLGLLQAEVVPSWIGWIAVVLGIGGLLSQLPGFSRALQAFFIPIVMHVAPALIGLSLALR
jgi:hypothetical protein